MKVNEIKSLLRKHLSLLNAEKIENIDLLYEDISKIKTFQLANISEEERKEISDLIDSVIAKASEVQEKLIDRMNELYSSKVAVKAYNKKL
ncbi:hypothetical protein SAMN06269117_11936 [Balnearium lithotrophicum]|uniref:Uncharacterized protein n=1 Tax=Balnearium lithotrophicum TaxID=223788 RepID=A0A521DBA1_9BACT|nr:hypothetical protein [Balnearium lithotrophicum]SMO69024.1 hypothetical protein SAMN06269117_11936 [Balnearium lithotrophicum]